MTRNDGTIFVSIASYRDNVCIGTLESIYNNAKYPDRIFCGIVQQNKIDDESDKDCLNHSKLLNSPLRGNISIIRIPHTDAKGPTWARYLASTLYDGQEYFLQIDSHTQFVKHWDVLCITMIQKIMEKGLSQKPVLSYYPKEISEYDNYVKNESENAKTSVPRICKSFFNERGILSFLGAEEVQTRGNFHNVPYVAGGFFFCNATFLSELPFDPENSYLFVGEEIALSARFYTNGWDIFTPSENICFHEYTREGKPKFWSDLTYNDSKAFNKMLVYLNLNDTKDTKNIQVDQIHTSGNPKYGMGKVRSLDDYYRFANIDIKNKRVRSNFCREGNVASEDEIEKSSFIPNMTFKEIIFQQEWIFPLGTILIILLFYLYRK